MPSRRGSRGNWCCSTTRSKLDVPLDDLAVHEPDARKLIAFLKAMEFSTLTRRVAEYSQIDPADVHADAGKESTFSPLPLAEKVDKSGNVPRAQGRLVWRREAAPSKGATAHRASRATGATRHRA